MGGVNINHFIKQLDYKKKTTQERKELLNDILTDDEGRLHSFFQQYYGGYEIEDDKHDDSYLEYVKEDIDSWSIGHKSDLSQNDLLSDSDPVSKALEKMANYLLFAPDSKPLHEKTKYKFYTEDKLIRRMKKDVNIEDLHSNTDVAELDEFIWMLEQKGNNYKKSMEQKIFAKDYKEDDKEYNVVINEDGTTQNILQIYQDNLMSMKAKYDSLTKINNNPEKARLQTMLLNHMRLHKQDKLMIKTMLKGTIIFKAVLPDSGSVDYDQFEFDNEDHVRALLKLSPRGLDSDLGMLIYDLDKILETCGLNSFEEKVLEHYRYDDMASGNIAKIMQVSNSFISATIRQISKKVVNEYKKQYEDWYYLNVEKGTYKKCSKCGEVKLMNGTYFYNYQNSRDGFSSYCKECKKKSYIE